jgi:hypothetical protein
VPWEEEFDKFDEHEFREFQNHWRQSEGEQWTNEFEQMKDQLSDRIAYSRYLDTLNDQQAQVRTTCLVLQPASAAAAACTQHGQFPLTLVALST